MGFAREEISFLSGDAWCAAWLYRPQTTTRRPLVVMAHGFSATREMRLDAYAERFADAGIGVLLFDYRHFGASAGEPRQLLDISRQHADYRAALAHARNLDWVDPHSLALFGSSFSGGHVLAVAARDERIAAVVSQCPFTDGLATLRALSPLDAARLTIHGLRDQVAAVRGAPPHYIPAAGQPGSLAVMTTPDALPGMQAITPAQSNWENRVAARITLRVALYRPGLAASRIAAPVLFCVCDHDLLCPPERTVQLALSNPRAEVRRYPIGHFDIYVGEHFERAVSDQVQFLVGHLSP
jgi:cephalosporin-C deacetylase-like acetyl esterase